MKKLKITSWDYTSLLKTFYEKIAEGWKLRGSLYQGFFGKWKVKMEKK